MADGARASSVFINCPFDEAYQPLFDALVFTIAYCGFEPRSALEIADSGEPRLAKIVRLIKSARFSIHDISRVQLDSGTNLPRFNMPIELGMAIGVKHSGQRAYRDHHLLVLDGARSDVMPERFCYQSFASDLAGVDIRTHGQTVEGVVAAVRDFLSPHAAGPIPGSTAILQTLRKFEARLPEMAAAARQDIDTIGYPDRLRHISTFIDRTSE